ncbi:MAG: DUF2073 domain-containing protein [Methanobacteriota archaeon]
MDIELEFVSIEVLAEKDGKEKMKFILDRIKKNKILVLEESLSPKEETELIESTMKQVSDDFPGIEVSNLREKTDGGLKEWLIRLLGGTTGGMTVIGPSKLIKKMKKEPQRILVSAGKK